MPRIGTLVPQDALPTVTSTTTLAPLAAKPFEALLQKVAIGWNCFQSTIVFKQDGVLTIYTLHCQIAAAESVDVYLEQFDTEVDAQSAFKPIPQATMTAFHGFPAAIYIPSVKHDGTTEYIIIQAKRTLITLSSRFDNAFGMSVMGAAESLYQALETVDQDFKATPVTSSRPTPIS